MNKKQEAVIAEALIAMMKALEMILNQTAKKVPETGKKQKFRS